MIYPHGTSHPTEPEVLLGADARVADRQPALTSPWWLRTAEPDLEGRIALAGAGRPVHR